MYTHSKIIRFSELQDPTKLWKLEERIGDGTYGEVYAAKNLKTGKIWELIEHTGCGGRGDVREGLRGKKPQNR